MELHTQERRLCKESLPSPCKVFALANRKNCMALVVRFGCPVVAADIFEVRRGSELFLVVISVGDSDLLVF